jgi:hypothetical protein
MPLDTIFFFIIIITSTRPKLVPNFGRQCYYSSAAQFIRKRKVRLFHARTYKIKKHYYFYTTLSTAVIITIDPNVLAYVPYQYKLEVDKLTREQHSNIHFKHVDTHTHTHTHTHSHKTEKWRTCLGSKGSSPVVRLAADKPVICP